MMLRQIAGRRAHRLVFVATLAMLPGGFLQAQSPPADDGAYSPGVRAAFPRTVYWGDTHLHTRNSFDAYNLGNIDLSPDDAYRFARGEQMTSQTGLPARLRRPLDFLVVADRGGALRRCGPEHTRA